MEYRKTSILPDGYTINRNGDVKNKHNKVLVNTDTNNCGYKRICIRKRPKLLRFFIHRAVASAFIENKDNKKYVNHKDGDKLNNHASNLEWVTGSENMKHAIRTGLLIPNTTAMIEHNRKHGSWNKGLKTS